MEEGSAQVDPAKPGQWVAQGLRSALFLRPNFQGLHATPTVLALLVVLATASMVALERLSVPGPALFYWQALATGWLGTVAALWVCWWLRSRADAGEPDAAPPVGTLFGVWMVQSWVIAAAVGLAHPMLTAMGDSALVRGVAQWTWVLALLWFFAAAARLLWPHTASGAAPRAKMLGALLTTLVLAVAMPRVPFWYPDARAAADDEESPRFELTQELFETQAQVAAQQRARLAAQRPGVVDLYALTVAPYATEDVFLRESTMVADVMRTRFDAEGRVLQLVNHPRTGGELPWATPINIERAINAAAQAMDHNEDILFIHLTSHGGRDGKLAAQFWPLQVAAVTAVDLKRWLDAAGVRFRVISVSACYSGTWIDALRDDHTLVMTAADAEHTSFGCGRGSELTYFGRALYDEQLRGTRSFEAAHAAARPIIEQREQQAGKTDGYSNPQIHVGAAVRERLQALQARLDGDNARH